MDGFARCSSSALVALVALATGCVDELAALEGTTSFRVEVTAPAQLGSEAARLGDTDRDLTVTLTAIDIDGAPDRTFSGEVDVFVQHLGSLSPPHASGRSLGAVTVRRGLAEGVAVALPHVYGRATLWVEHARGDAPTFATGVSRPLWYRDPWLSDISTPADEAALDALERSPLERKQVVVHASRYAERGRLIVTGAYAQGYTVSDVQCADDAGTPPCTTGAYDHVFVFTFGRPEDSRGVPIRTGHRVVELAGGVSEFNGLTEIGFPRSVVADDAPRLDQVPAPVVIEPGWLDSKIELERLEAALVAIDGATMCPLDDTFATYGQWKLDIGRGCADAVSVITQGQVAEFLPADHVGQVLPRVVGTLRPVNVGSFHVWIVYPRTMNDITIP